MNMCIEYRSAILADLDFLVSSRLAFIQVSEDMPAFLAIEQNTRRYFEQGLRKQQCDIILAQHGAQIVGTGIVFYYNSVPSQFNPWGKNAYITSMYVKEEYRRRQIGYTILDKLIGLAKEKGYSVFILQESEMGRPLYQKYGFIQGKPGMILKTEGR